MIRRSPDSAVRVAVFPGSFNPFTVGHADILERALAIFDRVIVCVGINPAKPEDVASAESRASLIRELYADDQRVSVECWQGLTSDFVLQHQACALVRGVRSVKDFEYERDLADANRSIAGVETVLLYASPQLAWVSSSLVRELKSYGRDVSSFLP